MCKIFGNAVQPPYLCSMNYKNKKVVDWTSKDAQDFLNQYDNSFDTITHQKHIISFNKIIQKWVCYDDYTWKPIKYFQTKQDAITFLDKKYLEI